MNIRIIMLMSYLACTQTIYTLPLIIMNTTNNEIIFTIKLHNSSQVIPIAAKKVWVQNIENDFLVAIEWQGYAYPKGSRQHEYNRTEAHYKIIIDQQIPSFNKYGGTIAIADQGSFLYDSKQKNLR